MHFRWLSTFLTLGGIAYHSPARTQHFEHITRWSFLSLPSLPKDVSHHMVEKPTPWYKDAVFYEVSVRSFFDSNGDGIGDFPGLTSRLDYIRDLGVDCIWILPMYPSPLRDDGYDISDYRSIHPELGTLEDFKVFLDEAHKRNLRVITDLVVNHTSDQHPWFQASRRGDPKYHDYYVWSEEDRGYSGARIIFTDTEASNWAWDPVARKYYWHRFFTHQPDLNYDNPDVQQEMLDIVRFWLDFGLDGFRCDAVPYLFEREGTNCENLPETHQFLRVLRQMIEDHDPNFLLLAEANQWPQDVRAYFGDADEFHMAFHFPLMPRMYMAIRQEDRRPIVDILEQTPAIPASCQWGLFLRNHDELTLEMVTDAERDYMYQEFAHEPRMRINLGIRRRLAPLMQNGRRQIELLNSLLLSLPGSPFLYFGDEIGMGDNIYLGDRNGVRTPMHWNGDRNAGFSRADSARLVFPLIMDPVYGYQSVNVEAQERTPTSLLQWMKRMLSVRRRHRVFGHGSIQFLQPENRSILAYIRADADETVLCVVNLSRYVQPVQLEIRTFEGRQPVELIGGIRFPEITDRPYFLSLGPHAFYWFRLEQVTVSQADGSHTEE